MRNPEFGVRNVLAGDGRLCEFVDTLWIKKSFSDRSNAFRCDLTKKTASVAFVAGGIAHLHDLEEDRVGVAVKVHASHQLHVAAFLPLAATAAFGYDCNRRHGPWPVSRNSFRHSSKPASRPPQ